MRKHVLTLLAVGALALGAGTQTVVADDSVSFDGYIRSGVLLNANGTNSYSANSGGKEWSFVPNDNLVGRLGTETDQYLDAELVKSFKSDDGGWTKMHVQMSAWFYDFNASGSSSGNTVTPYLSAMYVEMGGMPFSPKATFWVGQRYYGREDIHIDDFKWRQLDGAGLGATGLVDGNLDVALMTTDSTANNSTSSPITNGGIPMNLQVRYKLMGNLVAEVVGGFVPATGNIAWYNTTKNADSGIQGSLTYYWDKFFGLPVGYATVALQAGEGMYGYGYTAPTTSGTSSTVGSQWNGYWSQLGKLGNEWAVAGSEAYRIVLDGVATVGDWDISPAVWAEYDAQNPQLLNNDNSSEAAAHLILSAVIRPVYKINKNFSVNFEGGIGDQLGGPTGGAVNGASGAQQDGISYKVTVAPTLSLDSGFWTRPQLRVFATYEGQDARLGPVDAAGDQQEFKFGCQVESWW